MNIEQMKIVVKEIVTHTDLTPCTDLRPVFEYARTMQPRPAEVIYLTDGIGPAPAAMEFPTLWVLTGEGEKPVEWGVEQRLEG